MDFTPVSFLDSPPYKHDDYDDDLLTTSEKPLGVWDTFSILTPPLTPVDVSSHDKEIIKHLSNNESRSITEHFSTRDSFQSSPAILNDIMWNSGQKHKRPDSSMDIDVRFNVNGTPISFDQPIANTFVDTLELFSFSLLENCCDAQETESRHSIAEDSDSEEEIDVVSVQIESKPKTTAQQPKQTPQPTTTITVNNTPKPRITLQKTPQRENSRKRELQDDSCSNTSDSEGEVIRISHNDLERKRRNELRNRFNSLRESIPSLSNNEKAAKIVILRKAYELVPVLQKEEKKLLAEKEQERRKHTELLRKLSKLHSKLR